MDDAPRTKRSRAGRPGDGRASEPGLISARVLQQAFSVLWTVLLGTPGFSDDHPRSREPGSGDPGRR